MLRVTCHVSLPTWRCTDPWHSEIWEFCLRAGTTRGQTSAEKWDVDEEYDVVGTKVYNIVQVLAYLILAADSV